MFKFKYHIFSLSKDETIRFFSASSVTALADIFTQQPPHQHHHHHQQQPYLDHDTQLGQISETHFTISHDPKLYISALMNCTNLTQIKQVHTQITIAGMTQNLAVANKVLFIYAKYKALDDAYTFFNCMKEKNPVSWTVMVGGFAKNSDHENCLITFREIMRSGLLPDNYTIPFVLRVCRDTVSLRMGREIHHLVYKSGLHLDPFVSAALVDMYSKCGVIEEARLVFDKMPNRDLITWTVMISAYAECGNPNESLVLFDRMREEGIVPDKVTMVTVVFACAKLGAMNKAKLIHDYISRKNFSFNVILGTALIDMYAKCGSVDAAREIFDGMKERNVVSWSAMIAAYGYHGYGRKALELFPLMLQNGITPNRITFVSLLYACSHSGLVDEGCEFLHSMWDKYHVRPDVKHYTCMVDLLGRAGRLHEAMELIEGMAVEKDDGLWGAVLGACRIHGNIELAEKAAKSLLEIQTQNPGHYVLLSNIYANAGRWEDVANVRDLMTKMRLKKIPGWTWIEVDNKIHQFGVGDKSHPQFKGIYEMLIGLIKKLELAGYVPDTNFVLHDVDEELKVGILYTHSEKLAITFGLISSAERTPLRITKNLRVCGDCHTFCKLVSATEQREIIVRDANRFHHFKGGACSCGDYW